MMYLVAAFALYALIQGAIIGIRNTPYEGAAEVKEIEIDGEIYEYSVRR